MNEQANKDEESAEGKQGESTLWRYLRFWFFVGLAGLTVSITVISLTINCILNKCKLASISPEVLIFSLGLIGASATLAISLWRGKQIDEQISKAQEQIDEAQKQGRLTQFQNAVEMATQKENPARCISGLRALESMHKDLNDTDRETIYSVALYVLSLPKKGEKKVSKTVRQWALDILIDKGFISQDSLRRRLRDRDNSMEMSVQKTMIGKDLSHLYFARKSKEKDSQGNKILNLSEFSFRDCNFFGANLTGVNFSNADFTDTRMYGVNLTRANLTNARGTLNIGLDLAYYYGRLRDTPEHPGGYEIRSWDEWKGYLAYNGTMHIGSVRDDFNAPDIEQDEWLYLVALADDNAPYPPEVGGDDEGEEGAGE